MPQRRPRIRGVRPPQQDRSRDTYVRIMDATECLLEDREFDAVRIEQVLSEARVSAGSFYSRFEGKEALLQALHSRYTEGVVELAGDGNRGAGVPPTLEARARAEVRHRIRRFRGRKALIRTAVLRYRRDLGAGPELVNMTRAVNARIVDLFRPCLDEIGHEDPERAVVRGAYFVAAICRDRILFPDSPHASSVGLPLSQLEDELTLLLLAYLRGAPDPA
jgi:AcrR family transcriptional regulator